MHGRNQEPCVEDWAAREAERIAVKFALDSPVMVPSRLISFLARYVPTVHLFFQTASTVSHPGILIVLELWQFRLFELEATALMTPWR